MDNSTTLTIASTKINQDSEGRYRLNDCHRASGGNPKDAPAQWFRAAKTKELVGEIETMQNCTVSPLVTIEGKTGGTYVCKELVYAYAMWINPKFHLMVIQAFDALVQGKTPRPSRNVDTTLPLRRARLAFSAALRFNKQMGMEVGQARLKALATAKAHAAGTVQQWRWYPSVLDALEGEGGVA